MKSSCAVKTLNAYSGAVHLTCRVASGRDVFVRAAYPGKLPAWEHYRSDRSGLDLYTGLVSEPAQVAGLEALARAAALRGWRELDPSDAAYVRHAAEKRCALKPLPGLQPAR